MAFIYVKGQSGSRKFRTCFGGTRFSPWPTRKSTGRDSGGTHQWFLHGLAFSRLSNLNCSIPIAHISSYTAPMLRESARQVGAIRIVHRAIIC
jgi:hypothetical protein